jgi:hypothetical protein
MKAFLSSLLSWFLFAQFASAQSASINVERFFSDTSVVKATIVTNLGKLLREKETGYQVQGTFTSSFSDSAFVNAPILLDVRGHFRKDFCYLPPLKIIFKYKKLSPLYTLGSLKLVSECKTFGNYDQYLIKEFLVYKIYNLITDLSFRVRFLNLSLMDSSGKKKTITEHAFLMEDIKDLAKRNNCTDWKNGKLSAEETDRRQMTIVAIFEYMIGNTDWGVPVNHNTRLIISKIDSLKRPFVVPYDFDYSGFVNTDYAFPDEKLGIENVQQRLYRGFPRSMEELNDVLDIFKKQKDNIYSLINNFDLLTSVSKKDMIHYLDGFYDIIKDPNRVNYAFIKNARMK